MQSILERNRENAKLSTGPRTPEGKARSSQNALKSGMYSDATLLPTEDIDEYNAHYAAMVADLKPKGAAQEEYVQLIADHFWRLRRCRHLEANCFARMNEVEKNSPKTHHDAAWAEASAWDWDCIKFHSIEKLGKHESRIGNALNKAMKILKELQREAREQQERDRKDGLTEDQASIQSGFVPSIPVSAALPTEQRPEIAPSEPPDKVENPSPTTPQLAAVNEKGASTHRPAKTNAWTPLCHFRPAKLCTAHSPGALHNLHNAQPPVTGKGWQMAWSPNLRTQISFPCLVHRLSRACGHPPHPTLKPGASQA